MKDTSSESMNPAETGTDDAKSTMHTRARPQTVEQIIMGTPAQFGNMVKAFTNRFYESGKPDPYEVTDSEHNPYLSVSTDPVIVQLGRERLKHKGDLIPCGYIVAISIPGKEPKTNLQITTLSGKWGDEARQWWDLLLQEMAQQVVWLDMPKTTVSESDATMKQTGSSQQAQQNIAKHELLYCNRWLFHEFFDNGRTDLRELVDEWLKIRQERDRHKDRPINPLRSMRTAINEERKRRNKR